MAPIVDVAIALDCSSSIISYHPEIQSTILEPMVSLMRKYRSNLRIALFGYSSHHDPLPTSVPFFTSCSDTFQRSINDIEISDGSHGDCKALSNAMEEALNLGWTADEKMLIVITDGPPCGLLTDRCSNEDGDIWQLSKELVKRDVTIVSVGVSSSVHVSDDFYCALARQSGGEYLPLKNAGGILQKIISSAIDDEETFHRLFLRLELPMVQLGTSYHSEAIHHIVKDMLSPSIRWMSDIRRNCYSYLRDQNYDNIGYSSDHRSSPKYSSDGSFSGDDEGYHTRMPTMALESPDSIHLSHSPSEFSRMIFGVGSDFEDDVFF